MKTNEVGAREFNEGLVLYNIKSHYNTQSRCYELTVIEAIKELYADPVFSLQLNPYDDMFRFSIINEDGNEQTFMLYLNGTWEEDQ